MHKSFAVLLIAIWIQHPVSAQSPDPQARYRVAVAMYVHETCTFCPGGDVTIEDWTRLRPILDGTEVLETLGYERGFIRQMQDFGDVELIGIRSPYSVFGGSSRSWNTRESFEHFTGMMLEDLESNGPWDGVFLYLHGALAVRDVPRPEAELAKRIRKLVGAATPIVATFDLHGNEDTEFLKWADGSFVTKRYPHYDMDLQGERAARYMRRIIAGTYRPVTATRKPPILTPTVLQWTGQSPSMDIMERARRWEAREDVFVSVFYGFPWSDVPDAGMTIQVMANKDQELADSIANDMANYAWRVRENFAQGGFPLPPESVARAKEALKNRDIPVVLADYSDRPGDATWILQEIVDQDLSGVYYAALRDEHALENLKSENATVGDSFERDVGGFTGEQAGLPVKIKGTIKYLGPGGGYTFVAAIEFGDGNLLLVTPAYFQAITLDELQISDIDPDDYDVFVLKSRVHFRRGFDENGYAKTIIVVDAPGDWVGTVRLNGLDYEHFSLNNFYPYEAELGYDPVRDN